ncbi:MAG TPA: choice-of-anchor tandem repeat GloVer-containing protein [Verrucomicrobiae bacterium]|nr:choice-of-anchor tandem repeat GloVer-containing protein [Verrucomicrobiae bacterium]
MNETHQLIRSCRISRLTAVAYFYLVGGYSPIAPAQGLLTTLWQFDGTNGMYPEAALVQGSDGSFYGTTANGGTSTNCYSGCGTVFKITPQGTLTTLYQFGDLSTDGADPEAGLVQGNDGNFYGTTAAGGTNDNGTVFRITSQGTLTTLWRFNGDNGEWPYAGLLQGSDGDFYGTTEQGGTNVYGTVFKITPQGTLTTLWQFGANPTNGLNPYAGLAQGSDGNFYGTTAGGGMGTNCSNGCGTVFKITPQGTLTTLYQFGDLPTDGVGPEAVLVQGSDGNFYGTTIGGGTSTNCFSGCGTVFRITPQGTLTTLWQFNGSDGRYPQAGLVQGSNSNFYGTTAGGGTNSDGTAFQITPQGTLTTLWQFNSTNGANPYAALVQGSDGDFYGTTHSGGTNFTVVPAPPHPGGSTLSTNFLGTVFRLALSGPLTVKKLQARVNLNPTKIDMDTCSLTASPALEPGFSVTNRLVTVDIGGAQESFTLNAKGSSKSPTNSCILSYAKNTKVWTLTASMKYGSWATQWETYGVTNATTSKIGVTVTLPVTVVISNQTFATETTLNYKAAFDKSGTLR